jgi:hypothetical protein
MVIVMLLATCNANFVRECNLPAQFECESMTNIRTAI